jgi:glycosyltransferase involved in cell wall biosynthesis
MTGARLTVGLTRHRRTELPLSSVHEVFAGIEAVAESAFETRALLPYHHAVPAETATGLWLEFLSPCSVVVTDDPCKVGRLRDEHGLAFRIAYVPLGSFPRGARSFRQALPSLRRDDCIVFSCTADRRIFQRLTGACRAGRAVLPFAVDPSRFAPTGAPSRQRIRSIMGWSDANCVFVYAGRITAEKNLHTLLVVFDGVLARHPQARLLVIGACEDQPFHEFGTGPFDMEGILQQVLDSSPRLREAVRRLPWVAREELPALLSACDVFLSLTVHHDENFGYGQVEAMSCGLPVVCTEWGGLKDTVLDGQTGLTVPTWVCGRGIQLDLGRAFNNCSALVESADLRGRLGRAGRARVVEEYSSDRFSRSWLQLLEGTAGFIEPGDDDNRLSPFGQAFEAEFGQARRPSYRAENYRLYVELIEPYTAGAPPEPLLGRGVAYLTPVSFELGERTLEVLDPLWPATMPISAIEHRLVSALEGSLLQRDLPFVPLEQLLVDSRMSKDELLQALRQLLALGIVGYSPTGAATELQHSPSKGKPCNFSRS